MHHMAVSERGDLYVFGGIGSTAFCSPDVYCLKLQPKWYAAPPRGRVVRVIGQPNPNHDNLLASEGPLTPQILARWGGREPGSAPEAEPPTGSAHDGAWIPGCRDREIDAGGGFFETVNIGSSTTWGEQPTSSQQQQQQRRPQPRRPGTTSFRRRPHTARCYTQAGKLTRGHPSLEMRRLSIPSTQRRMPHKTSARARVSGPHTTPGPARSPYCRSVAVSQARGRHFQKVRGLHQQQ